MVNIPVLNVNGDNAPKNDAGLTNLQRRVFAVLQRGVRLGQSWRFHHLRQRSCETGNFHFARLVREIDCIVESCRRLGVPIRQYLLDVLPGLADRSIQSLTELTPTAYAAKMAK